MAQGKRRTLGELAAWHACLIISCLPFTARVLNPTALNPYRDKPESEALARVKARMREIQQEATRPK